MAMQHPSQAHNVWQENPISERGMGMALSAIDRPDTGSSGCISANLLLL